MNIVVANKFLQEGMTACVGMSTEKMSSWVSKYFHEHKIRVLPTMNCPKESAKNFKAGEIQVGQDGRRYVVVSHIMKIPTDGSEKEAKRWQCVDKKVKKQPATMAKDLKEGATAKGGDGKVWVVAKNTKDEHYWHRQVETKIPQCPTESAESHKPGELATGIDGQQYRVTKNKTTEKLFWTRVGKRAPKAVAQAAPVTSEAVAAPAASVVAIPVAAVAPVQKSKRSSSGASKAVASATPEANVPEVAQTTAPVVAAPVAAPAKRASKKAVAA